MSRPGSLVKAYRKPAAPRVGGAAHASTGISVPASGHTVGGILIIRRLAIPA